MFQLPKEMVELALDFPSANSFKVIEILIEIPDEPNLVIIFEGLYATLTKKDSLSPGTCFRLRSE